MAINSSALVVLVLACSIMVATAQSDICCDDSSSFSLPGSDSGSTLNYQALYDGSNSTYGSITVGYVSPRCGSCASASYTLKPKSCKFDGSLPSIKSFKCTYYLSYVSSDFSDKKETRSKQPCYYTADISRLVNATFVEQCTTSYIGVLSSSFSLSGPSSVATVSCKGLFASPQTCYTYSSLSSLNSSP